MRPGNEPVFTAEAIGARVRAMADEISRDYRGRELIVLVVLKGALHFASDLTRAMGIPTMLDFIRARSYGGTHSRGEVELISVPMIPLTGQPVLLVEDILDTGRTTSKILEWVTAQGPDSVRLCTLIDKRVRRVRPVRADYTGFEIAAGFVVGYGLDHDERYRELSAIYELDGEPR